MPLPAEITDVEYEKNHFLIYWQNPNRLKSVRLEVSVDGGKHWETVTTTLHSPYKLSKDGYKDKIHIRAVAMNGKEQLHPLRNIRFMLPVRLLIIRKESG